MDIRNFISVPWCKFKLIWDNWSFSARWEKLRTLKRISRVTAEKLIVSVKEGCDASCFGVRSRGSVAGNRSGMVLLALVVCLFLLHPLCLPFSFFLLSYYFILSYFISFFFIHCFLLSYSSFFHYFVLILVYFISSFIFSFTFAFVLFSFVRCILIFIFAFSFI